jgi:hypothetical protein
MMPNFAALEVIHSRLVLNAVPAPNKPLVPTRNGDAPLLAAQRRR